MSKGRVPSARRKTGRTHQELVPSHRFLGVSLSGGKADKSCVVVLDDYPHQGKIFLARSFEQIKNEPPFISADQKIFEILISLGAEEANHNKKPKKELKNSKPGIDSICFDVPLSLPKCLRCSLICPGVESCIEPEIQWLKKVYKEINQVKRPQRIFTPYIQRCSETWISFQAKGGIELQPSLGANLAPLAARALFLARRLSGALEEVQPRLAVWRMGTDLKINPSQLKRIRHSVDGEPVRNTFLQALLDHTGMFVYQQDFRLMVENLHAFDAFICALTGLLHFRGLTEKRPSDFPKGEIWIQVPQEGALKKWTLSQGA